MRILMTVKFPMDKANELINDGTIAQKLQQIMADIKPESAYFTLVDGHRGMQIVVNMKESSELPRFAEPFFLTFGATIEAQPCFTAEDLAKAGPDLEASVRKYGGKRR